MTDTLTPNILLTNQTEGGNNNTWGSIADANFELIDNKFGDTTSVVTTGGSTVLTDNQELVANVDVSGTLATDAIIQFTGRGGFWVVRNGTSGAHSVTCKLSASTGVAVPSGTSQIVWCNGSDIRFAVTSASAAAEVTVASAATCNIAAAGSSFVAISGTVKITSFGSGVNTAIYCRATGAFTIGYNASTLITPGAQDIPVTAGDTFVVIFDASSNARVAFYTRMGSVPAVRYIGEVFAYAGSSVQPYCLFPYGQLLSRTTYAALFAIIGTTYGIGDGSTTFGMPDCRGRVDAGKDDMGGSSANRLTNQSGGLNGDTLGATGGEETHILVQAELPNCTFPNTLTAITSLNGNASGSSGATKIVSGNTTALGGSVTSGGSDTPHNNVQPTIIFNKMMFVGI